MKDLFISLFLFIQAVCTYSQVDEIKKVHLLNDSISRGNTFIPNPYRNKLLSQYFDISQTDFSKEFLALQTKRISETAFEVTDSIKDYFFDTSTLFCTGEFEQNGILGLNNQRIKIHIEEVSRDGNSFTFSVKGKSNVDNNICDFIGKIRILSIYKFMSDRLYAEQGMMYASYEFFEDKGQAHAGVFRGYFEAMIRIKNEEKSIELDERLIRSFLYSNRTFVGIWIDYNKGLSQRCIWGDYRLPFTFDFDCGDKVMTACEKYIENGWRTYSDGSEYDCSGKTCSLKNKWWKNK